MKPDELMMNITCCHTVNSDFVSSVCKRSFVCVFVCSGLFASVSGEYVPSCPPAVTGHAEGIKHSHTLNNRARDFKPHHLILCVFSVCPQPTMRSWRFCCRSSRFWARSDSSAVSVRWCSVYLPRYNLMDFIFSLWLVVDQNWWVVRTVSWSESPWSFTASSNSSDRHTGFTL